MKKESLDIAINNILETIERLDINIYDKLELMLNLRNFLDSSSYDENIQLLNKNIKRKVRKNGRS